MTDFREDWLALREPADMSARNGAILRACVKGFARQDRLSIIDLGSGCGSTLRAMAQSLPPRQHWTLVDKDAALLSTAQRMLGAWADKADMIGETLVLEKSGKQCHVAFLQADLVHDYQAILDAAPDLVTASALFDLVSKPWLTRFCADLAKRKLPLYAALTYNGAEMWTPPHPFDSAVLSAFHAHQAGDKGFGPSAGPDACDMMIALLEAQDYHVQYGASDWDLTTADGPLIHALAEGIISACREIGRPEERSLDLWLAARRTAQARIGHTDIFAALA